MLGAVPMRTQIVIFDLHALQSRFYLREPLIPRLRAPTLALALILTVDGQALLRNSVAATGVGQAAEQRHAVHRLS